MACNLSFSFIFLLVLSFLSSNIIKSLANQEMDFSPAGINSFSVNLFKTLARKEPGNIVCSPISVQIVTLMAKYGTNNFRKQELSNPSYISQIEINNLESYSQLVSNLKNTLNTEIYLDNKLYVHNQFPRKPFEQLTQLFTSEIEIVNIQDTSRTAQNINNWSRRKTNNTIKNLISPDDLKDIQLAMVSTGYFKGNWVYPFKYIAKDWFNRSQSVPVIYMKDTAPLSYGPIPNIDATYLELPYKSNGGINSFSMYCIIPNKVDGLNAIIEKLHNIDFAALNAPKRNIDVFMPVFKLESKTKLTLADMKFGEGIRDDFFNRNYQNYLKTSEIIHKSFINVDLNGSESAYETILEINYILEGDPPKINIDRPFIAAIISKPRNIQLMWARIDYPSQ